MFKNYFNIKRKSIVIIMILSIFQISGLNLEAKQKNQNKKKLSISESNLKEGREFLEENKKKPGIVVRESGLQYQVLKKGTGLQPRGVDEVEVHYHGTLINGKVFDSSVDRGKTIRFPVRGVIRGWQEALMLMSEGSKWKIFVPSHIAYGERSAGRLIGPNKTLIFVVELIKVIQ